MQLLPRTGKDYRPTPSRQELGPEMHTHGYHGTTIESATSILRDGFDPEVPAVFFYPSDSLGHAKEHGRSRALRAGRSTFVVIEATFPEVRPSGSLESPYLIVPKPQIDEISLLDTVAYPVRQY